jgi:AraC family transcriptional activator of mtrCDE
MSIRMEPFADALSAIFARLGLHAEIYLRAEFCGEWGVDTSGTRKAAFHLIEHGRGWLHTNDSDPPRLLGGGDLVVFPHDAPHCISSSPERPPADIVNIVPVVHEGQMTRLLCGYFEFRNPGAWPLLAELPDAIILDLEESGRQNTTHALIQLMIAELEQERPGVGAAINELAYLLFIQVVRSQIDRGVSTGILGALSDVKIGRALNALHSDFATDWSVDRLAAHVGMSRSVFSERFSRMISKTPMRYLAEWRMQEAAHLLESTDRSIANIAECVGYGSEMAFRKAFRKIMGRTPGTVRRSARRFSVVGG